MIGHPNGTLRLPLEQPPQVVYIPSKPWTLMVNVLLMCLVLCFAAYEVFFVMPDRERDRQFFQAQKDTNRIKNLEESHKRLLLMEATLPRLSWHRIKVPWIPRLTIY